MPLRVSLSLTKVEETPGGARVGSQSRTNNARAQASQGHQGRRFRRPGDRPSRLDPPALAAVLGVRHVRQGQRPAPGTQLAARPAVGHRGRAPIPPLPGGVFLLRGDQGRGDPVERRQVAYLRAPDRGLGDVVAPSRVGRRRVAVRGVVVDGGRGGRPRRRLRARPQGLFEGDPHRHRRAVAQARAHLPHQRLRPRDQELIWSAEGRSKDTLEAFFAWLGEEGTAALEGICCDMWANYIDVIKDKAPQATLVFDKFHIVRHLLRAVNDVRKMEQRALRDASPELLKGTRYIWLKNPENLTELQRTRLSDLEHMNLKTVRAYLLKELFAHLWTYTRKGWAKRFLDRWFWWATHSRLKTAAGLRLDAAKAPRRDPRLLRLPHRQRARRGHEQQREGDQPPRPRVPHGESLHAGDASLSGRAGVTSDRAQICVRSHFFWGPRRTSDLPAIC
ncbi:MAG: hypothetical protein GEU68_16570 [Actinobacteria bacterium]|nr:hypothetical protein [Actinomycetota bacterium]